MDDIGAQRLFRWLDRSFWLIWLGFPLLIWLTVTTILAMPTKLAEMAPDQAACIAALPHMTQFSATGQIVFWAAFGFETAFYAILMVMAHRVIHLCATGRVFVEGMIGMLKAIGLTIAVYPSISLIVANLTMAAYWMTGDLPSFMPEFALDLPVMGVGLLLVTIAAAMRMGLRLRRDADLTI